MTARMNRFKCPKALPISSVPVPSIMEPAFSTKTGFIIRMSDNNNLFRKHIIMRKTDYKTCTNLFIMLNNKSKMWNQCGNM